MMDGAQGRPGRVFMLRIDDGEKLVENLGSYIRENDISTGSVSLVGAVKWARIVTPDIEKKPMPDRESMLEKYMEVVGHGDIVGGKVHIHAAFGEKGGNGYCGHLVEAEVFVFVEAVIQEIEGIEARREHDPKTGFKKLVLNS